MLHGAAVAVLPLVRKRFARAQVVVRRKKEEGSAEAVRDAKLAQRLLHRLHAVSRHSEQAKCFPSELPLVLFGSMCGLVVRSVTPRSPARGRRDGVGYGRVVLNAGRRPSVLPLLSA